MREADRKPVDAEPFGTRRGPSVQRDGGRAAPCASDFHLSPSDPARARAQSFHRGFLGGESRGELRSPPSTVGDLTFGVDALKKAIAESLERRCDPFDLDDVHADGDVLHGVSRSR